MWRRNDFTRLGFRGALGGKVQLPMMVSKLIHADFFYLLLIGKSTLVLSSGLAAPIVSGKTRTRCLKCRSQMYLKKNHIKQNNMVMKGDEHERTM